MAKASMKPTDKKSKNEKFVPFKKKSKKGK